MKERLVELVKSAPYGSETLGEYFNTSYIENCIVQHLLENGVIVPPCKVGDKVYYICENSLNWSVRPNTIYEATVTRIVITRLGTSLVLHIHNEYGVTEFSSVGDWCKTVFLTREEAEAKLKEGGQG